MDFSNVDLALGTLTAYDSGSSVSSGFLNADKHSPASSARSTKRRVRGDAYVSGS